MKAAFASTTTTARTAAVIRHVEALDGTFLGASGALLSLQQSFLEFLPPVRKRGYPRYTQLLPGKHGCNITRAAATLRTRTTLGSSFLSALALQAPALQHPRSSRQVLPRAVSLSPQARAARKLEPASRNLSTAMRSSERAVDTAAPLSPPELKPGIPDAYQLPVQSLLPSAAYVHIPFCRRRCHYCDFAIVPVGSLRSSSVTGRKMEDYVATLQREIGATQNLMSQFLPHKFGSRKLAQGVPGEAPEGLGPLLSTVYFGGGTPSLLPPHLLSEILSSLDSEFGIQPGAEISLEMDPGTFDQAKLRSFLEAGVNRVSLGVQSFQERLLKACGRAHDMDDVYKAVELLQSSGIASWSIDLISSLPFQTLDDWNHSLSLAVATGAPHVSVYDLQVEAGTPFGRWYTPGESPLPSDEAAADMYRAASSKLRAAGYSHYEVSSYAVPGFESRHNMVYWDMNPYLAFGMSASSYLGGLRCTRPRSTQAYTEWVSGLEAGVHSPLPSDSAMRRSFGEIGADIVGTPSAGTQVDEGMEEQTERLLGVEERKERLLELVMLRLRTSSGLDLHDVSRQFGMESAHSVLSAVGPYLNSGHVLVHNNYNGGNGIEILVTKGTSGSRGIQLQSSARELYDLLSREDSLPLVLRLSDPEGFLISNDVISSVFAALD